MTIDQLQSAPYRLFHVVVASVATAAVVWAAAPEPAPTPPAPAAVTLSHQVEQVVGAAALATVTVDTINERSVGLLVSPQHVVTVATPTVDAPRIVTTVQVTTATSRRLARVITHDPSSGLLLAELPEPLLDATPVTLPTTTSTVGTPAVLTSRDTHGVTAELVSVVRTRRGWNPPLPLLEVSADQVRNGSILIGLDGRLVGMVASHGTSGPVAYDGTVITDLLDQVATTGEARWAHLPAAVETSPAGLVVVATSDGSPLLVGDIVTSVGAAPVTSLTDLASVLATYRPGATVTVTVRRPEGSASVDVALAGSAVTGR